MAMAVAVGWVCCRGRGWGGRRPARAP
jgi:hypothetical protein